MIDLLKLKKQYFYYYEEYDKDWYTYIHLLQDICNELNLSFDENSIEHRGGYCHSVIIDSLVRVSFMNTSFVGKEVNRIGFHFDIDPDYKSKKYPIGNTFGTIKPHDFHSEENDKLFLKFKNEVIPLFEKKGVFSLKDLDSGETKNLKEFKMLYIYNFKAEQPVKFCMLFNIFLKKICCNIRKT